MARLIDKITFSIPVNKNDFDNVPGAKYSKWVEAYDEKIRSRIIRYRDKEGEQTDFQFQVKRRWKQIWFIGIGKLKWRFLIQCSDYITGMGFCKHVQGIGGVDKKDFKFKPNG